MEKKMQAAWRRAQVLGFRVEEVEWKARYPYG